MLLTNLTNTKWRINSKSSEPSYGSFDLLCNFDSYENKWLTFHIGAHAYYNTTGYHITQEANNVAISYRDDENNYIARDVRFGEIIEIFSGDVIDTKLISWLKVCATQLEPTYPNLCLGKDILFRVSDVMLLNPTSQLLPDDFYYNESPSVTTTVKLGKNTLENVNEIRIKGDDGVYKSYGFKPEEPISPTKGQIINIDMNGDGITEQYRVIKVLENNVVEVLGMTSIAEKAFSVSDVNTYAKSMLDATLNSNWYNTLSTDATAAIVDKTFSQDAWCGGVIGSPIYQGKNKFDNTYQVSLENASYRAEITRHVYALSVQDILDYLEVTPEMTSETTTLTSTNIFNMFLNSDVGSNEIIWLRSGENRSRYYNFAWRVFCDGGALGEGNVVYELSIRPAFQIDLSKIQWSYAQ